MRCGTLQALGPVAQDYMLKHGRFEGEEKPVSQKPEPKIDAIASEPEKTGEHDAIADTVPPVEAEKPRKKTLLDYIVG